MAMCITIYGSHNACMYITFQCSQQDSEDNIFIWILQKKKLMHRDKTILSTASI